MDLGAPIQSCSGTGISNTQPRFTPHHQVVAITTGGSHDVRCERLQLRWVGGVMILLPICWERYQGGLERRHGLFQLRCAESASAILLQATRRCRCRSPDSCEST